MKHLGVIDWGIGGVSVLRELQSKFPRTSFTYYSDTGAPPYGTLSHSALTQRLEVVVDRLVARGVDGVVLACNAASTVLMRGVTFSVPTLGMIEPSVNLAVTSRAKRIGVVGGRRTIRSRVYRNALAERGIDVVQRIAQPLSAAIERGHFRTPAFAALVEDIVRPLRDVDALLLACTHYPAALAAFALHLPGVHLLDPAREVALSVRARWSIKPSEASLTMLTSGDKRSMHRSARLAWGR
ncbi:MAG: aspartate/glutamate racemase family protein [Sandaracinaceae bacterium]|nr:aspartate/glutamate racemase family protein [Sandaracinaceae bacterium]